MTNSLELTPWIKITKQDRLRIREVINNFQIPEDFLSGVFDPFEIARIEHYDDGYDYHPMSLVLLQYSVINKASSGFSEFRTRSIAVIKAKDTIITATHGMPSFLTKLFEEISIGEYCNISYEKLVMEIYWRIACETVASLRSIHREIEKMESDIENSSKNKELYRLMALSKSLSAIDTAILNNRKVLAQMADLSVYQDTQQLLDLMHDIKVESLQAESMVDEAIRTTDQLSDIFTNVISNNLNNIMKVLTSITIVMTIPTILGGIWGMNVPVPFQENPMGLWIILLIMAVISGVTYIWLKHRDYM